MQALKEEVNPNLHNLKELNSILPGKKFLDFLELSFD